MIPDCIYGLLHGFMLGCYFYSTRKMDKACKLYDEAVKLKMETTESKHLADNHLWLADNFHRAANFKQNLQN